MPMQCITPSHEEFLQGTPQDLGPKSRVDVVYVRVNSMAPSKTKRKARWFVFYASFWFICLPSSKHRGDSLPIGMMGVSFGVEDLAFLGYT